MNDDIFGIHKKDDCLCCHGTGVQRNQKTGLVQECPCCFGSGKRRKSLIKKPIYISRLE